MIERRFVLSRAKEVYNEKLQDIQICHAGIVSTSSSHKEIYKIANNAPYESVISDSRHLKYKKSYIV